MKVTPRVEPKSPPVTIELTAGEAQILMGRLKQLKQSFSSAVCGDLYDYMERAGVIPNVNANHRE